MGKIIKQLEDDGLMDDTFIFHYGDHGGVLPGGKSWERFAASHPRARMIQEYPEQRLGRLFEELKVPHVFMKPVFEASPDVFLPTRAGHLNPGAQDLAARTILKKLTEVGLVD